MTNIEISIVAPALNEEECIEEFVNRTCAVMDGKFSYELVIVDDGSTDKTWDKILSLSIIHPSVRGIKLSRNFGHQFALLAGLESSRGSRIAIIDADLQDPPELIPEMLEKLKDGCEIVYGERVKRDGEKLFKKISAKLFYKVLRKITPLDIPLDTGDFRVVTRRALDLVLEMNEPQPYIRGLFAYTGLHSLPLKYNREIRFAGSTKYTFKKMLRLASSAVFGFSELPFRVFLRISWFFFISSILFSIAALVHALLMGAANGWISIFVVVVFFGSMNLLFLALIGNYIITMNIASKNRPRWIVEKKTSTY